MSKPSNYSILGDMESAKFEYWNDPEIFYDIGDLACAAVLSNNMFGWSAAFLYRIMIF